APLYGGTPQNLSPSPTLLVESHRVGPADSGTRLIPGQVLSLFLEPVGVRHSAEDFPSSRIGIPANSTVISMRGRTESVVWLGPAPARSSLAGFFASAPHLSRSPHGG